MSGKRQGIYILGRVFLWGLRNCQGCVPKTLILRWDPVSSARIIKFFLWDITDFPWAVQMMNFPWAREGEEFDTKYFLCDPQ